MQNKTWIEHLLPNIQIDAIEKDVYIRMIELLEADT